MSEDRAILVTECNTCPFVRLTDKDNPASLKGRQRQYCLLQLIEYQKECDTKIILEGYYINNPWEIPIWCRLKKLKNFIEENLKIKVY